MTISARIYQYSYRCLKSPARTQKEREAEKRELNLTLNVGSTAGRQFTCAEGVHLRARLTYAGAIGEAAAAGGGEVCILTILLLMVISLCLIALLPTSESDGRRNDLRHRSGNFRSWLGL